LRILITGMAGFAGKHLVNYLINTYVFKKHDGGSTSCTSNCLEILGADIRQDDFCRDICTGYNVKAGLKIIDLRKKADVEKLVKGFKPDYIYHLAAQSSVSYSWKNPRQTLEMNVFAGINLFESVKQYCPGCRILVACTSEEYDIGNQLDAREAINENFRIYPLNPYAISKAALDFFASTYYKADGLLAYVARSFNHTGPGQSERFVVSDFAKQVAEIEAGLKEPVINVGNLNACRDFLDVRDAVRAYKNIIEKGRPGQAYNVCSGKSISISEILDFLVSLSSFKGIEIKVDKNKIRPVDSASIHGDNSKIKIDTGWEPVYDIKTSLSDTLQWWRERSK